MIKNKYLLTLLSLAVVPFTSLAATNSTGGELIFNGSISDTTCTINGADSGSETLTIILNPITIADAGNVANTVITKNQKTFDLTFSNCTSVLNPTSNLKIYFNSAYISNNGLYLVNTEVTGNDAAEDMNVGFSISRTQTPTTAIQLNDALDTGFTGAGTPASTLSLVASYYKTSVDDAKPGRLVSSVMYTVSYL